MDAASQSVEAIFDAALELTDAAERAAMLDRACAGNPQVRARVEKLLAAHERSENFFSDCAPALAVSDVREGSDASTPHIEPVEDPVGSRIGPYKLLQKIGEGGCGAVYMAEQEKPVRRRVALKIIKLGMDTKQVIARFEAERQALAMMDHPNIARVLDAGATETGRPYFVMELVHGIRITEYCDKNSLSTRERLELFIQVCHAIQHAHQKGIIHRDIKPSNVLVTLHDGVPVPKVIDFGIAKAIEEKLTDKTLFTMYGHFIGTPAYMSPEQAQMSGLDVDTRSDIYSLGVLLYELLTGKTPFDQNELMASGLDEMRRTLREREPHRPSTKLDTMANTELTMTAQLRHVEPPGLRSELQGDLDWIVMKALEKDRTRRYQTANGLGADVQRYLSDEPVMARPPSRLYRFQKLVQRNRVVFTAVGAVAAALIIGFGVSTWLFVKERAARRRAMQAEQVADEARQNEAKLRQQAETRERVTFLISRGQFEDADRQVSRLGFDKPTIEGAAVLRSLAEWHALRGNWPQAAARYEQLLKIHHLDNWDTRSLDFLGFGAALAEAGDQEGFVGLRAEAVNRTGAELPSAAAARLLKIALLRPADRDTLRTLEPLAQVAIPQFSLASPEPTESAGDELWRRLTLVACGRETVGAMSNQQGVVTFVAGGTDTWKRQDSFDFACMMVPGDFDFRLRVHSIPMLDKFTRVGLMARDSLKDPASRHIMAAVNAEDTFQVLVRPKAGAEALSLPQNPLPKAWGSNSWVRLQRAGSVFRAYSSDNGRDWVFLDYYESASGPEGPLAGPIHVGIAACAHSTNVMAEIKVSDFGVTSATSVNAMLASALMRYRSGNAAQCEELCRRYLSRPGFNAPGIALTRILLALACYDRGETNDARAQLIQAREMVERNFDAQVDVGTEAQGYWFDWVFARTLLDEAEQAVNSGAFGNKDIAAGTSAAFVQGTSSFSQTVTLSNGQYILSFYAKERDTSTGGSGSCPVAVSVGSLLIQTIAPTNSARNTLDGWSFYSYSFNVTNDGAYTLKFEGTLPFGVSDGHATYVDNVFIVPSVNTSTTPNYVTVINPSFEDAQQTVDLYTSPYGTLDPQSGVPGWQLNSSGNNTSYSGIVTESGTTLGSPKYIPQRSQAAFIQGTGQIQQSVTFTTDGTYVIRFRAKGRSTGGIGAETIAVSVDGNNLGNFTPDTTQWDLCTTPPFTVTAGVHTISFAGTVPFSQSDRTTFVDAVQIVTPAEATTTDLNGRLSEKAK